MASGSRHRGSYAALVVVFAAAQLFVCAKYGRVIGKQVWSGMQSRSAAGALSREGEEGFNAATDGFPPLSLKAFLSGTLQGDWERLAKQNFPFLNRALVPAYRRCVTPLAELSLEVFPASSAPVRPLFRTYTRVNTAEGERLCDRPTLYHPADDARLAERAAYYQRLHRAWPQVHFSVFATLPAADWLVVDGTWGTRPPEYLAGDLYVRRFRTLLDPDVGFAWAGQDTTPAEVLSCYYRTDHHWNGRGAYQVYRQVWSLLHTQKRDLSAPLVPQDWKDLPHLEFRGSFARRAGYYEDVSDTMTGPVLDLPPCEVCVHGFAARPRNAQQQYESGRYAPGKFANHYGQYFGDDYGLIRYTSLGTASGHLLVIGDSYDNCLELFLASHFHTTWFVDLRHYAADVGTPFDLDDFVARNEITDVIFLGMQLWTLGLAPLESFR